MKVAIATPTLDGNVTYEYLHSLRALENDFRKNQIQSTLITLEGTTLAFARNTFASIVMNDKSYTHLLFVDADMGFMPEAVMKLICSGYAVTGCMCPTRQLNLVKLHAASRSMTHPEQAQLAAADYVAAAALERNDRGQYVIKDGFVRTRLIGMGITLIRREALEELAQKLPELVSSSDKDRYYAKAVKGPVLQCFANIYADGVLSSEDVSFCKRWIQCGGEIWALIDQTVIHVGGGINSSAILPSRCRSSPRLPRICRLRRRSQVALCGLRMLTSKSIGEPKLLRGRCVSAAHLLTLSGNGVLNPVREQQQVPIREIRQSIWNIQFWLTARQHVGQLQC